MKVLFFTFFLIFSNSSFSLDNKVDLKLNFNEDIYVKSNKKNSDSGIYQLLVSMMKSIQIMLSKALSLFVTSINYLIGLFNGKKVSIFLYRQV